VSTDASAAGVPAPETTPDEPLLVFVHIRKTAGKTLRQILYRQYTRGRTRLVRNYFVAPEISRSVMEELAAAPPPELRVVHGHVLFWQDVEWPEETQFLTLLRDPVERTISHYYWLRSRSSRFKKSLEEAVRDGSIHDNLQTRVLAAEMPPFGETTDEMLESALKSLKRLDLVGLTDRFDETLVLATRVLGWKPMLYRRENVTPDRKPREEISSKAIDLIKRHNELDIELYRSASKRFEREVESYGDELEIDVAALKRANQWAATVPDAEAAESLRGERGDVVQDGEPDLRELLVDTRADVLKRDSVIERLTAVSTPRGAARTATRTQKRENPLDRRRAGLEAAIQRATTRLENLRKEVRASEKEGLAVAQPDKLESLRAAEATTAKRLEGFERRRDKLVNQAQEAADEERADAAPKRRKAAAAGGAGQRKKKAAGSQPKAEEDPQRSRSAKITGTRRFEGASADTVWDVLDQPDRVVKLIPAVESFEVEDASRWTALVKIPLRPDSPLQLQCEKSDGRKPEHGRLTVRGRGAGTAVTIDGVYDLTESNGGTDLKWRTDVELTGPVGPLGGRVLRVLVRNQMKNLLEALEREVAATSGRNGEPAS
jgi:carbon monoxide dehydrogenase subunit G